MIVNVNHVSKKMMFFLLQGYFGVLLAVLVFSVVLSTVSQGFLSSTNIFAISRTFALWIFVGFAQMAVLVIGQMNLSVGSIGGLAGVATGFLFQVYGAPTSLAVAGGLAVGMLCGAVNGLIITKTGINAFIVTLGTSNVFLGIIFGLTQALPFSDIPESFKFVGGGSILGTVPILALIMVGVAILLWILFNHSLLGRRILAVGGNQETARLSGISVNNITLFVHVLSGFLAGLAGVFFVARLGAAHPTIGMNWLLMSFAVPIIGGTALAGGGTSIFGVVLGGILMTLISNGLVLLRVNIWWEQFFLGLLLLAAVGIDRARTVYASRKL